MRPERAAHLVPLLALALLLSACGFQLRGYDAGAASWPDSLARMQLTGADLDPDLERRLAAALRDAGAALVDTAVTDAARLDIVLFDETEVLSALGIGSTRRDHLVTTRIDYTLRTVDEAAPRSGSITANRTVQSSADQVNAAQAEVRRARRELRDEVIATLLRRLAAGG